MGEFKQDFLKNYVDVISGVAFKSDEFTDKGIPVIKIGNISNYTTIKTNYDSFIDGRNIENYRDYLLALGNVLIAMSGNTTCKMGKVSADFSPSLLNQRVGWIKPLSDEIDIDFIYHLLISESYQKKLWTYATATGQPNLSPRDIKRIIFPKPPKPEQTAIAKILSKVDETIEAAKQSIKAAEKLKKALIHNLLSGKLKPDGTWRTGNEFYEDEKFGKVPKGWNVKRIKDVFEINTNTLPSTTNPEFVFNYITIENVSTELIDFEKCITYKFKESPGRARRILKDGDILISGVRPNLKSFAIYENPSQGEWICSTGFYVLSAKKGQDRDYYFYQILSSICESQFYSYVAGTNYPAIGDRDIRNMLVYSPDLDEQIKISNKLKSLSTFSSKKLSKIQTLERLKKSLMQQLLTGKKRLSKGTIAHINQTL